MRQVEASWTFVRVCAVLCVALSGCGSDSDGSDGGAGGGSNATITAESWTQLGFDNSSQYRNPHETKITPENAKDLKEKWHVETLGSVTGMPCILGDIAIVVSQGRTYKMNMKDGSIVWENKDAASTSSPACTEDTVYVDDARADLVSIRMSDGHTNWKVTVDKHDKANGFSSPVVAGDKVIVGTSSSEETSVVTGATFQGSVVAFDRDSGKEAWRYHVAEGDFTGATVWSTVSVSEEDNMVFAATGNNYTGEANDKSDSIIAISLDEGKYIWHHQCTKNDVFVTRNPMGHPDDDFGANPILFEAMVDQKMTKLVGAGQKSGTFWVFDRMTGAVIWQKSISGGSAGQGGFLNNGAYDGEYLIAAGNHGTSKAPGSEPAVGGSSARLVAMDPSNGDIKWERQLGGVVWAPISVANGVGFVSTNTQIQAFNTKTGEKLWSMDTAGTIGCGASISGGRVLFGSGFTYTPDIKRDKTLHMLSL
jgi:polyvinyl alcohol dehydrogenase (cytochrome)